MEERARGPAVRSLARAKLGRLSRVLAERELRALPGMLSADEALVTMASGMLDGASGLVLATDQRLLLLSKGPISRRERAESLPWPIVRSVRIEGLTLVVDTATRAIRVRMVNPPERLGELADLFRLRTGVPRALERMELMDLARRKLGGGLAWGLEVELSLLHQALEPDETLRTMASAEHDGSGLLAASSRRLVFCRAGLLGGPQRVVSYPYERIRALHDTADAVEVDVDGLAVRFACVSPPRRAGELVLAARAGAPGDVAARDTVGG
jgi:Bacterial PH domain